LNDNTVKCWGENDEGRLGDGSMLNSATPVLVSGISNATQVSAGGYHTCALLSDNTVKCWGSNDRNALGNGSDVDSTTPVLVSNISTAIQISVGGDHSCALLSDSTIKCWGYNISGQLGNGDEYGNDSDVPVSVLGISTATQISIGMNHSCALLNDKTVKCWGDNFDNQLGIVYDEDDREKESPVSVVDVSDAIQISAGSQNTCVLLSDDTAKCWGRNQYGQVGNRDTSRLPIETAEAVVGITTASQISVGNRHVCVLLNDTTIKCWGGGTSGQLGDGTQSSSGEPVSVVE